LPVVGQDGINVTGGTRISIDLWSPLLVANSQTTFSFRKLATSSAVNPNSASTSSVCSPNSGGRAAITVNEGQKQSALLVNAKPE
jgi:hypothetical protein